MHERVEDGDRGQIILISALLMAVLFVGLAVVVNSAVYAENRGTRDVTTSSEALAEDPPTEDHVIESLARANYHSDTEHFNERRNDVESNVSWWRTDQNARGATEGEYISSEVSAATNGTRISQETKDDFTPAGEGLTDGLLGTQLDPLGVIYGDRMSWVVAPDVQSRAYKATVERSSLETVDNEADLLDLVGYILTGVDNDPFGVAFSENDVIHTVYLVKFNDTDGTSDVAAVVTEAESTADDPDDVEIEGVCRLENETVTLNVGANELVAGDNTEPCPELSFSEDLNNHNVTHVGSDSVSGTYRFIVDKDEETLHNDVDGTHSSLIGSLLSSLSCWLPGVSCDMTVLEKHPSDGYPFTTQAVYSVSVNQTYVDDRVTYEQNSTFAPAAK